MQAVNSLRLVLGTMLDITDDDQELAFDPDDPNARTLALYGYLGGLLDEIVDAQLETLRRGSRRADRWTGRRERRGRWRCGEGCAPGWWPHRQGRQAVAAGQDGASLGTKARKPR